MHTLDASSSTKPFVAQAVPCRSHLPKVNLIKVVNALRLSGARSSDLLIIPHGLCVRCVHRHVPILAWNGFDRAGVPCVRNAQA